MMPRWEVILLVLLLIAAWATADSDSTLKKPEQIAKEKTASPENKGERLEILSLPGRRRNSQGLS